MKSYYAFWKILCVVVIGAMLAACGSPPAPISVPTSAPTESTGPIATEAATEPTTTGQLAEPIPYPEAPALEVDDAPIERLPIDQIVTYKALPEYHEPEWVTELVNQGKLPPVEERLPKEPQVYLKSGMKDGVGVYGDLWRGFSACPTAGYNFMAGTTLGWFGIESYTVDYDALVKTGPLYRADQDIEPFPNLAKSWEWSEDGTELTMNLVEGVKWSDGEPFTADDVMFTWDGYIADDNVIAPRHLDSWSWDGQPASLEKVDDFTIKFTFPVSKPLDVFFLMNEQNFNIEPAHILQPLHPKWSTADPKPTYEDFANALPPDDLPLVTTGPWVVTEYQTDQLMILRRNPYYWKVDEEGNQLPYLDEIQYVKGTSGTGRDLCVLSGECDLTNLENPSSFVQAMTQAQEPDAQFTISWGPELLGFNVLFNYSLDVGAPTDRDKAIRELNRDLRFRKALSYATDRDGIAQSIMRGPLLRGWAGGLYPGAPDFDRESVVYYPYDPDSARTLLAEIGLKDTDNDGVLEWTEGPMAGEPVVIQLLASQDQQETQSIADALVNQWGEVGLKINVKVIDAQTRTDTNDTGTWDMVIQRETAAFALPVTNITALAPTTKKFAIHQEGNTPRELLDFEPRLVEIANEYRGTFDAAERKQLMFEYNNIYTENVYSLGIFSSRYGAVIGERFKNVANPPVFLYTWVEDSILLDTLWTPEDQQLEQNRPNTIPVFQ